MGNNFNYCRKPNNDDNKEIISHKCSIIDNHFFNELKLQEIKQNEEVNLSNYNLNDDDDNNNKIYKNNASGISFENKVLSETVVKIEIEESEENKNIGEFILILDTSESMGEYVPQILNEVMPKVLNNLNLSKKKIHLITFSDTTKYYCVTKNDFKTIGIKASGYTQMLGVIPKLKEIIETINKKEYISILALSDGKVHDREQTTQNLELLIKEISKENRNINSHTIRFISSEGADPDTRLLCSLLKFNIGLHLQDNYLPITFDPGEGKMNEEKINEFSNIITKLFNVKKSGWRIVSDTKNMRIEPFGEKYNEIELPEGKSILFIDEALKKLDNINLSSSSGEKKTIDTGEEVNKNNVNEIYQEAYENIVSNVIRNKISGTQKSFEENKNLINYIEKISSINEDEKEKNKLVNFLNEINNNEEVKNMDEKQINSYINEKKDEYKKELDYLIKRDITINIKNPNTELFLVLDTSESMEKYINNLLQNTLYKSILRMGFNDKDKIKLFGFSSEDSEEVNFIIEKLKTFKFVCMGERGLFDCLHRISEIIVNDTENEKKKYILLFLFSGEIIDKQTVRKLSFEFSKMNKKINMISRIIKYIIDDSDFPKNENNKIDLSKDDQITYGLIQQLNSEGMNCCQPLVLYENENEDLKINKIVKLFR